jgi:hypothetical protein
MGTLRTVSNPETYEPIASARERLRGKGVEVTAQTVRRWAKSGKVRAQRLRSGGQFLVCAEDIDALIVPISEAVA